MNKQTDKRKKVIIRALVLGLEFFAVGLVLYLIALPFYPKIKYKIISSDKTLIEEARDIEAVEAEVEEFKSSFPESEYDVSPNRIIIKKIGVNAPIVESASSEYGLSKGAWLVPDTSTPDAGGNTVITGHRFKYLPPHNMTFYLFHKLEKGDIASVIWHGEDYYYRVRETKIIEPTDFSILEPTDTSVLTMFTCNPIYSTDERLVIIADLIEE